MSDKSSQTNRFQFTVLLGLLSAFLVFSIIMFPEKSFNASLHSLTVWWTIVFPALLPFLIIAEIMLAYGLIHFFGVMLEPIMRLLFKLPGVSGPVMAIGFTIGYPIGAKLTQKLRHNKELTKSEGEMLLALSHVASPLLMINVIAVGFFHNAQLGLILTLIQLVSLFAMGIVLRCCLPRDHAHRQQRLNESPVHLLRKSFRTMRLAHLEDGRTFGKLLGDAVSSAIQTLMMIGGYMMIFAVIIQVLTSVQFTELLYALLNEVMSENMYNSLFKGVFEIHLGSFSVAETIDMSLQWQMTLMATLLAWSGLSMHAQVSSLIQRSDLRYSTFLTARLLHACLAFILTLCFWTPLSYLTRLSKPSFLNLEYMYSNNAPIHLKLGSLWGGSMLLILLLILILAVGSMLILVVGRIRRYSNR